MIWRVSVLNKIFLGNLKDIFNPQIPELINSKFTTYSKKRTYIKTSDFWHHWHAEHTLPDDHLTIIMAIYIEAFEGPSQKIEEALFNKLYNSCIEELLFRGRCIIQNRKISQQQQSDRLEIDQTTLTTSTATSAIAAVMTQTPDPPGECTYSVAIALGEKEYGGEDWGEETVPVAMPTATMTAENYDKTIALGKNSDRDEIPATVAVTPDSPMNPLAACWLPSSAIVVPNLPLNPLADCWRPRFGLQRLRTNPPHYLRAYERTYQPSKSTPISRKETTSNLAIQELAAALSQSLPPTAYTRKAGNKRLIWRK